MNDIIPIDAKALIQELNGMCIDDYNIYCDVFNMIENAEVLDYAPVTHAHWIIGRDKDGYEYAAVCSHCDENCGASSDKFCRNCGAKMDEEAKG